MSSTRIDINVIGSSAVQRHRVAASATRFYAGEPLMADVTLSSGIADANTVIQAADATPNISTASLFFVGISAQNADVNTAGTVLASDVDVIEPIPNFTRLRSKAKDTDNCDTLTELVGLLYDVVLFDFTSTVFTIDETGTADTSGLQIRGGIYEQGLIDVVVDVRAMRTDVS